MPIVQHFKISNEQTILLKSLYYKLIRSEDKYLISNYRNGIDFLKSFKSQKNIDRFISKAEKKLNPKMITEKEEMKYLFIQRIKEKKNENFDKDFSYDVVIHSIMNQILEKKCEKIRNSSMNQKSEKCDEIRNEIDDIKTYEEAYVWISKNGNKNTSYALPDTKDDYNSLKQMFDKIHPPRERSHHSSSTKIIRRHSIGGKQTKKKRHPL